MKTNITIELNPINCGIYEFRHVETGLAYVGSAIDVRSRIAQHFKDLSKGRHHNKKAQELYDSSPTGNCAFEVRLIESCSVDDMDDLEDGYIRSGDYTLNTGVARFGRKARMPGYIKPQKKRKVADLSHLSPEEKRARHNEQKKIRQREQARLERLAEGKPEPRKPNIKGMTEDERRAYNREQQRKYNAKKRAIRDAPTS